MNEFQKLKIRRALWVSIAICTVLVLAALCLMMTLGKDLFGRNYYVPDRDENVVSGVPRNLTLEWIEPRKDFQVGFHLPMICEENRVSMYVTNPETNSVYFSVLLYDEQKQLIAGSGLIQNGEYLPYMDLQETILTDSSYYIKIVAFDPDKMTSEGSAWIRVDIGEK